ncbi:MAG: hypothetical protein AAGF12_11615 [Myxococcota bacterium]
MTTQLSVHFDPPGFFLNDPRLVVKVEGQVVHDGSFRRGFTASAPLASDRTVIETSLEVGTLRRRRRIEVDLAALRPDGYRESTEVLYEARLEYSRFWGNFKKRVDLRRIR